MSQKTLAATSEAALAANEQKFRRIIDATPSGILMVEASGRIVLCNTEIETLFGYSRAELLGKFVEELIPARFRPAHPGLRDVYLKAPETRQMGSGRELFGRRKNGTEFPVEIGLNPLTTEDGSFVLASVVDITKRKSLEETFRRVVEATPNGILMVDHQGKISLCNSQIEILFGYDRAELLGQPIEILVPVRFRGNHPANRGAFFASPETRQMGTGRDLFGLRKDGREFPVEIGLNPMKTEEGTFVLASVVDITTRKSLEDRFRKVIEAMPAGILMVDKKGKIVLCNAQFEYLFGYERSEIIGREMDFLVPERFRSHHPDHRTGFFGAPETRQMGTGRDLFGLRKDGREFPVEIGLNPMETTDGTFVLASIVDISTRKLLEDRFRKVIEAAPTGILMVDRHGKIVLCNSQFELLFGYERHELIGKEMEFLVPERFRPRHPHNRNSFFSKPETRQMGTGRDLFGLRKDGREFPVEIGLNPMETEDGTYVLASIVDITMRKTLEERFRKVIEATPTGILMVDKLGKIVLCNSQFENLFGYHRSELIGKEMEFLVPERFRRRHPENREAFFGSPETRQMGSGRDLFGLRKDGREFPVEIGLNPLETDEGTYVLASIVDITTRKTLEEKFRKVIEAAPTGILMVDRQGVIVLCNSQFETLFGYDRSELIGKEMEFLVPARFRRQHPGNRTAFFGSPETRQMGIGRDLYGLRKNGDEFPVEIGLNPLETDEGSFVLASIVDITKRKFLEDKIRHSATALHQKNHEMEQFVYTVSHDLKSPLVTSTGFLGILKQDLAAKRDDRVMDSVGRLERANARMGQLIDDLLQLSRIGTIKLEPEQVDVGAIVQTIGENLSGQLREKGVRLVIHPLPKITADRRRVFQVLENLIINALKYGCDGPNSEIVVDAKSLPSEVQIVVKDLGPGIAEEYHQKIFGLFQRLEADNRGTGVGLTIVARIMQLHGGRVWVDSAVGRGAAFWVAFPVNFAPAGDIDFG